jgi:hypothetical protein
MSISEIKENYPALYSAARDLYGYDKKVHNSIYKKHGKDSLNSIILVNEYNKQIENSNKGIFVDTNLSKLAKNRVPKYNLLVDESFKVKQTLGPSKTLSYMETLYNHFI